jgi:hypothetical protein
MMGKPKGNIRKLRRTSIVKNEFSAPIIGTKQAHDASLRRELKTRVKIIRRRIKILTTTPDSDIFYRIQIYVWKNPSILQIPPDTQAPPTERNLRGRRIIEF